MSKQKGASLNPHALVNREPILAWWPALYFRPPWEYTRPRLRKSSDAFLAHRLTFPQCIAALDAALAGFIPRMMPEDLIGLRAVMLASNEIVMKEMERRGPRKPS
jgi:hypothetical protein